MRKKAEPKYEDQFTAFLDFLGFQEASTKANDVTRLKVLDLLLSLSSLRQEFDLQTTRMGTIRTHVLEPAISTFSDHIVISYPLRPFFASTLTIDKVTLAPIVNNFMDLLTHIVAAALRIGFLVRGGATIGKLYHARGIVFGEALVDAYQIESRISVYPRVVLSRTITTRESWVKYNRHIVRGFDGLYNFDYFQDLLEYGAKTPKKFVEEVVGIVARNLTELERRGRLNELAKWAWFAREFRQSLKKNHPKIVKSFDASLGAFLSREKLLPESRVVIVPLK